jgi:hypothetical protein
MGKKKKIPNPSEFVKRKCLVRINRQPLEDITDYGFILDYNDDFMLVNTFDFDANVVTGFSIYAISTIKEIKAHVDENSFESIFVKLNKIKPKKNPSILIDSIQTILKTVTENFPLIVIHCEKKDNEICWIGKLVEIKDNSFLMLEIDTNADWHEKPSKFKFKDVTKIDFGGGYENNLALVAEYREKLANKKP